MDGRLVTAAGGTRYRLAGRQHTSRKGSCCGSPGLPGAVAEGAGRAAVPARQAAGQAPRPLWYARGLCPACSASQLTCVAVMSSSEYEIVCSLDPFDLSNIGSGLLCDGGGRCPAGHSLGGAVAKLCTLRLLHQLASREAAQGHVKCVAFAAPALGNAALAMLVLQQGWSYAFYNLTLPGMSPSSPLCHKNKHCHVHAAAL